VVCRACRQEGIPLVIHVTDDYVDGLYSGDLIGKRLSKAAEHSLKEVAGYASKCIAISPLMASDFAARYGRAWDWCTTLVRDREVPGGATRREESKNAGFRLVYAGSLELNRWVALRRLANFISKTATIEEKSLCLDIWCKDEDRLKYQEILSVGSGAIRFRGWLERDELQGVLVKADLCVHAESSFEEDVKFTRLSLSTKISQYLFLGKPVLALAPRSLASVSVLEEAGACVGVCDSDEGELDAILRRCVYDGSFLAKRGVSGRKWAMTNLNTDVRGQRILTEIAAIGNNFRKT
jgi:glycosyltransferase involved in cell wall biosynthesis